VSTSLKLKLVRGDKVILEVPLFASDWSREQLETEFEAFEEDFDKFSKVFGALSNMTRIKMLRKLVEEEDRTMNFAGFMRNLDLNPKTVWEHSKKLTDVGFLNKTSRGTYHCSEFGQSTFLTLSLVLRQILDVLEEI
jgi:DNA-binding transcriptional ArsR family regulator